MNISKKSIIGICVATLLSGNVFAIGVCENIHAPTGVVGTDASTTAKYAVSHRGIRLISEGSLTVRYPLNFKPERVGGGSIYYGSVGLTDSYSDASIKVELVRQRLEPVPHSSNFLSGMMLDTQKTLLFDSQDWGEQVGYRRENLSLFGILDTEDFVYSLEVTLKKEMPFGRFMQMGAGFEINNIQLCWFHYDG